MEGLLQRVADGVLPEDRRDAMEQLRDLLQDSAKVSTCHPLRTCLQHFKSSASTALPRLQLYMSCCTASDQ